MCRDRVSPSESREERLMSRGGGTPRAAFGSSHGVPDDSAKVPIDPDLPNHRDGVHEDANLMNDLARTAILDEWPDAVIVEPR
jgi:hypothetical protein